jgi:light-regulated signal transduction histidine kinase (bacteriophytochrome)
LFCENKKGIPRLFKIDSNITIRGSTNEGKTGLGLLICAEFVHKHKVKLGVESQTDEGSYFFFTIPFFSEDKTQTKEIDPLIK